MITALFLALTGLTPASEPFPPHAARSESISFTYINGVKLEVRARTMAKEVPVRWRYFEETTRTLVDDKREKYATTYWPLATLATRGDTVYVSGVRRNGKSVIEKWTFAEPMIGLDPADNSPTSVVPGDRLSVESLYNEDTPDRYLAVQLHSVRDAPQETLLVRFFDSGDVYTINESTLEVDLLATASSTPPQGVFWEPSLLDPTYPVYGGTTYTHLQLGHMYLFRSQHVVSSDRRTIVLFDGDRNGTIDSVVAFDTEAWASAGLGLASNYE